MLFQEELQSITELLNQVIGTSLSEITDMINLKNGENIITNKEVKLLLVKFLSKYNSANRIKQINRW